MCYKTCLLHNFKQWIQKNIKTSNYVERIVSFEKRLHKMKGPDKEWFFWYFTSFLVGGHHRNDWTPPPSLHPIRLPTSHSKYINCTFASSNLLSWDIILAVRLYIQTLQTQDQPGMRVSLFWQGIKRVKKDKETSWNQSNISSFRKNLVFFCL